MGFTDTKLYSDMNVEFDTVLETLISHIYPNNESLEPNIRNHAVLDPAFLFRELPPLHSRQIWPTSCD
jgi:hypothetical protein